MHVVSGGEQRVKSGGSLVTDRDEQRGKTRVTSGKWGGKLCLVLHICALQRPIRETTVGPLLVDISPPACKRSEIGRNDDDDEGSRNVYDRLNMSPYDRIPLTRSRATRCLKETLLNLENKSLD
jgi:hypothetical protein